ncbi:MAG: hypothetical protein ABFR90_09600 [Planctomycetota bacterium]
MKIRSCIALSLVLIISGCVPSLHQLWTKETLVYDEAFVGSFKEGDNVWQFTGDPNDTSYELVIAEKEGKKSQLDAHLVDVQGQLFFDFYPSDDAEIECGDWLKFHLVRAHLFLKVEKTKDAFSLAVMDSEEVGKLLQENPKLVKHEFIEDSPLVLTDTPENLQKFLIEAPKLNDKVFGDPMDLVRITD